MKRFNKIKNLLNKSPECYYWLGFLLADGHFSKNNRLTLSCSIKDKKHLIKFVRLLNLNTNIIKDRTITLNNKEYRQNVIKIMDTNTLLKVKNDLDINNQKTYNPPNIEIYKKLSSQLFFPLLVGYIDGDGMISNQSNRDDCFIRIKVHSSWLDFLIMIRERLEYELQINIPKPKINKGGYALLTLCNIKVCRFLKNIILDNKLECLHRKWDKIDINRKSKYEITKENTTKANELFLQGFNLREVAEILKISEAASFLAKRRIKNGYLLSK